MHDDEGWARLRQVIIATDDIDRDAATLRSTFRLGPGARDPELADYQMSDAMFALADGTYLQLIATHAPDALAKWLAKVGGPVGYALSIQHPDPAGVRARAQARGVGVVRDLHSQGYRIVQLHPRELGILLEADGIADPDVWFWDDLGPDARPTPGAKVDATVAVVAPASDPAAMGELWHDVLGLPVGDDPTVVKLGGAELHFVRPAEAPHWTIVLHAANGAGQLPPDVMPGVTFRYLSGAS